MLFICCHYYWTNILLEASLLLSPHFLVKKPSHDPKLLTDMDVRYDRKQKPQHFLSAPWAWEREGHVAMWSLEAVQARCLSTMLTSFLRSLFSTSSKSLRSRHSLEPPLTRWKLTRASLVVTPSCQCIMPWYGIRWWWLVTHQHLLPNKDLGQ